MTTGARQGYIVSPVLYTLFTRDCVASHEDIILKFADDTAVIGRIAGEDETAFSMEVSSLVKWCEGKPHPQHGQDQGDDSGHEEVDTEGLSMSLKILSNFYSCIFESILTGRITAWYASTAALDRGRLQRVENTAERITGTPPPSPQSIYQRCLPARGTRV